MTIQITQGSGTSVATGLKGSAHHQRVLTHKTRSRIVVTPTLTTSAYALGDWMGGLIQVPSLFRGAPEATLVDSAEIEGILFSLKGSVSPFDFDLLIFAADLMTAPVDNAASAGGLTSTEALDKVQAIIQVRVADFAVGPGNLKMAHKRPGLLSDNGSTYGIVAAGSTVFADPGASNSLHCAIVCQASGGVTVAADSLSIAFAVAQD